MDLVFTYNTEFGDLRMVQAHPGITSHPDPNNEKHARFSASRYPHIIYFFANIDGFQGYEDE